MKSATTTRTLNRRPRVERQVLALLRGREGHCAADDDPGWCFAELRDLARQEGLKIMPPETAFLSSGELTLLSWLARAQRSHAPGCRPPDHPRLAAAIEACARILSRMNLRLYPLTLYAYRIRT
ncbi:hypothetical protein [Novosphingobium sp.]|jgi:hypothetical protein|uniref:hypothetical protein n=1 Tax=Novosphingobium sp. TaxID=1874826 RepID=UPI002FE25B20